MDETLPGPDDVLELRVTSRGVAFLGELEDLRPAFFQILSELALSDLLNQTNLHQPLRVFILQPMRKSRTIPEDLSGFSS